MKSMLSLRCRFGFISRLFDLVDRQKVPTTLHHGLDNIDMERVADADTDIATDT